MAVFMLSIQICCLLVIKCDCGIYMTETKELVIGITPEGNLLDPHKVPTCGSDQKIHLVSYMYHQFQCEFVGDCISTNEVPLLGAEQFLLHEMCSMRQKCRNLSNLQFPVRSDAQRNRTNAITIKYECIDQTRLADICVKINRTFTDVVYLTSVGITNRFADCQCFVNSGRFSISIADLRLNDNIENKCSPAILNINRQEFSCDEHRDDYGSTFEHGLGEPLTNGFISLIQHSDSSLPDMVLIKLQPESSLKITCNGQSSTQIVNVYGSTSMTKRTSTPKTRSTTPVSADEEVRTLSTCILPLTKISQEGTSDAPSLVILTLVSNLAVILLLLAVLVCQSRQKHFW